MNIFFKKSLLIICTILMSCTCATKTNNTFNNSSKNKKNFIDKHFSLIVTASGLLTIIFGGNCVNDAIVLNFQKGQNKAVDINPKTLAALGTTFVSVGAISVTIGLKKMLFDTK